MSYQSSTMGATKRGEYSRTLEMLSTKIKEARTVRDMRLILYFLADSQYSREDLLAMADQAAHLPQGRPLV